jgi:hypothetical protein
VPNSLGLTPEDTDALARVTDCTTTPAPAVCVSTDDLRRTLRLLHALHFAYRAYRAAAQQW